MRLMLARAYNLRKCGVSTCANVVHMATKYEWTAFDYASQQAAAKIIADSGYSYRTISEMMNNAVSHVRISDIEKGRKAPIKLSEFLLLCQACEADPVAVLRDIIEAARAYESRERLPSPSPSSVPACPRPDADDDVAAAIRDHERYGLAANTDGNRDVEAETPDW